MKENFSKRLKTARKMAGLSMQGLVDKMDNLISKQAISKYEKGLMFPNSEILVALANALDIKLDYFFRALSIELHKIEFRKHSKLKVNDTESIKWKIKDFLERYVEIEAILDIDITFLNPVSHIIISTVKDVEIAADTLRDEWKLGVNPIPNIISMLEDKEFKVFEVEGDEKFDGLSGWGNGKIPVIVVNKKLNILRKRLTLLHELAHLLLQFDKNLSHKDVEKCCHAFAAAFLFPMEEFAREFGRRRTRITRHELIEMGKSYGISAQAIMARAKNLRYISSSAYKSFFIKWNELGYKKDEQWIYEGAEYTNRFHKLLFKAVAEDMITVSKGAELANMPLEDFGNKFDLI